jgi:hypothetical protein
VLPGPSLSDLAERSKGCRRWRLSWHGPRGRNTSMVCYSDKSKRPDAMPVASGPQSMESAGRHGSELQKGAFLHAESTTLGSTGGCHGHRKAASRPSYFD